MKGERGFALVITLIVTALLVALLVEFVNEVYVDASHSHNFVASQQAAILAESGIEGGIQVLKASALLRKAQKINASYLLEPWAKPLSYDAGVGTVTITIEEENGKLDLNSATTPTGDNITPFYEDTTRRLLTNLGLSQDLYEALIDWVDQNDTPKANGAENSYYSTLKPPYQAHNDKLNTFEELGLVKGFTPQVLTRLRPFATAIRGPGSQTININTAPKELLAALDPKLMTGDLVGRILEYRKTKPIQTLNDIPGLDAPQLGTNVRCQGWIYRIHSEGKVGESVSVAEAVVNLDGKTTVLYWREY